MYIQSHRAGIYMPLTPSCPFPLKILLKNILQYSSRNIFPQNM